MLLSNLPIVTPPVTSTKSVDLQRILRAVASSTAIETGQPSREIEQTLRSETLFRSLELATPVPSA
ncbi:MAG: hypothetical protein EPN31_06375 [Castellaniella sp.]|uniref:hypothetical protein n=1 Tax=Castellaniella sp. TaxID=1955812 RepID=UPI00120E0AF9|nr:hypothetical protein [Castellaniella sp.]TAN29504.1 MAG: hypothetical protein EPN31_06375 [Castellaniella sp.]